MVRPPSNARAWRVRAIFDRRDVETCHFSPCFIHVDPFFKKDKWPTIDPNIQSAFNFSILPALASPEGWTEALQGHKQPDRRKNAQGPRRAAERRPRAVQTWPWLTWPHVYGWNGFKPFQTVWTIYEKYIKICLSR